MLYNVSIWFLDQENIGLDPKVMILHEVISEILEISDFEASILKILVILEQFSKIWMHGYQIFFWP